MQAAATRAALWKQEQIHRVEIKDHSDEDFAGDRVIAGYGAYIALPRQMRCPRAASSDKKNEEG